MYPLWHYITVNKKEIQGQISHFRKQRHSISTSVRARQIQRHILLLLRMESDRYRARLVTCPDNLFIYF